MKSENLPTMNPFGFLKKKTMICSTEAAAISIGIHVLLIVLAGSVVAVRYVQKREAAFKGEVIVRPKLERRQLQMPVKVKSLQKKSARPKITTRMATVSQISISLPQMGADWGGGFDRVNMGERSLSSMGSVGSLGFGISGINFFGVKSKGEKVVFAVEAAKEMMRDDRGGYATYKFAKDRLSKMISELKSATLFNVMFFTRHETVMFNPKLVPATEANKTAVIKWYAQVNASADVGGEIQHMETMYSSQVDYDGSVVEQNATGWTKAAQAAMEQRADNIFILCSGWGTQHIGKENIVKMFETNPDASQEWLSNKGWSPERIAENKKEKKAVEAEARERLAKENAARIEKGLPPRIVPGTEWRDYIEKELKLQLPPIVPRMPVRRVYETEEILGHLEAVYEYCYKPRKLERPKVHMVKLIAEDDSSGNDSPRLMRVAREFDGRFELLRGAETMEDLIKYNK